MRKTLRQILVAATGAAVFASGAAIAVATPAHAATDFTGEITLVDTFLPPSGSSTIDFSVKLEDAYITGDGADKGKPAKKVWARYTKDSSGTITWAAANVTQPAAVTTIPSPNEVVVKGGIPVQSADTPGDKWRLQLALTATDVNSAPAADSTAWTKAKDFPVAKATRISGTSVSPNPVYLKSGKEIDVYVEFKLEKFGDEKVTDVRLESEDDDDYYSLTTGLESDGSYHDSTAMDYSTAAGDWQLKVTVTRGSKTYSFVKGFEVKKSSSGKAKSKITIAVSPSKVKKGKTVKVYGKVYRGYSSWGAWSKKILKLYFKKKGSSSWKFVGYVGANSSGNYSKVVKPKYDGYWRLAADGTSKTNKALSAYKFVDVK